MLSHHAADADLEALAATLEASGRYRVLRRVEPCSSVEPPPGTPTRLGLLLDLETTGLDPKQDEIIEWAMLPFTYGLDGTLYGVGEAFSRLRQPSRPIPPAVTELTGITDAMVAGQRIDPEEVAAFAAPAALVIAHNAGFDRRFAERFWAGFADKPWACSMDGVDWAAEGFEGRRLGYLAMRCGLFFGGHRAVHDCRATLAILARPLPRCGQTALARLLDSARQASWRIWAADAPFEQKDRLKARGYRWNGEATEQQPRAWYRDVTEAEREAELAFLREEIYGRAMEPPMRRITARDRYSERV
ncbi:3'-5' exonuclease [Teichococcus oryzae]|uniref:3'-5' exonuclease n=1 Tax=Teichococcus oryzae TaxID=1608942 RepID=A0A5B2T9R7_9PROT|nr:3'-5' exonuclease [Pseudoroseomonas oryzae]KAA2211356.1 3'-5' exonuclease [Pseudoroseomonas oryzae]